MLPHLVVPVATTGPLADLICTLGLLAVFGWISWRFGPTLARVTGWASGWVAWACGSQGGYAYCAFLLVLGILAWGGGTVWYAKRRGRWPSALSARVFARLLGHHNPLVHTELPAVLVLPHRRR